MKNNPTKTRCTLIDHRKLDASTTGHHRRSSRDVSISQNLHLSKYKNQVVYGIPGLEV
ncbi:hypothetical protein COLO4_19502 [Corchorus olitorius]|uniref:Uncharacterized protein n=1 Tax=Corchorus olitorius TaxID=93759 RepID=A0A1R3J557_9ROSI|nr:hypothetical protein COLO4_19502 [Corchorus olitorius]